MSDTRKPRRRNTHKQRPILTSQTTQPESQISNEQASAQNPGHQTALPSTNRTFRIKSSLLDVAYGTKRVFFAIGAIGGIIADVLTPLWNRFSYSILCVLIVITLILGIAWYNYYKRRLVLANNDGKIQQSELKESCRNSFVLALFSFFLLSTLSVFGVLLFQDIFKAKKSGVIASEIGFVSDFQSRLFGLEDTLNTIKDNTSSIKDGVLRIEGQIGSMIIENVANPKTPLDWYTRAKFYKTRGDSMEVIQSVEAFLVTGSHYYDPCAYLANALKNVFGKSAHSEYHKYVDKFPKNMGLKLAYILEFMDDSMIGIDHFSDFESDYLPALFAKLVYLIHSGQAYPTVEYPVAVVLGEAILGDSENENVERLSQIYDVILRLNHCANSGQWISRYFYNISDCGDTFALGEGYLSILRKEDPGGVFDWWKDHPEVIQKVNQHFGIKKWPITDFP